MCRLLEICCRFMSTAIEYIEIQDCASSASCVCVPDCKAANDCDWESKKKWNLCVSACVWVSKRATTTIKSHPNEAENVRCFVDERGQSTKSYVKDFYVDILRTVYSLAFGCSQFGCECVYVRACDAEPYRLSVYVYEITMRLLIARQFVQMYWLLSFSLAEIAWAEAWFGTVVVCTLFRSYDYVQYLTMFMFESYIFDEIITKFLSVCIVWVCVCI